MPIRDRSLISAIPALALFLLAAAPAPRAPVDRVVCDAPGNQTNPAAAADGRGGAIVVWADLRGGAGFDVYAQHLLASGRPDPGWPAGGLPLCRAAGDQAAPAVVSDGHGGAVATWFDQRGGKDHDVYAQRVSAAGGVAWTADGVALCTAPGHQQAPCAVADGAGGAIVAWFDHRAGDEAHIYAQHVTASGAADSLWPADGLAVCTAAGAQYFPRAIGDGAGGAFLAWYDHRSGAYDIYAHHVLASGRVDPAWPVDGRALCVASGDQRNPVIVADGRGGAFVAWEDGRAGARHHVYAHHLLARGEPDPAWPADGLAVCDDAGWSQRYPAIAGDGRGGLLVAWEDDRERTTRVYAQRVLVTGRPDPRWPAAGQRLSRSQDSESAPLLEADGAGAAIAAWQVVREGGDLDLGWTRLDPRRPSAAPAGAGVLCAAPGAQMHLSIARVARGAVVALWDDGRSGSETDVRAAWLPRRATSGTRRTSSPEPGR